MCGWGGWLVWFGGGLGFKFEFGIWGMNVPVVPMETVIDLSGDLFIGLDVSTRSTGYCFLHTDGTLMEWGAVTNKEASLQKYAESIGSELERVRDDWGVHEHSTFTVCIESYMKSCKTGMNTQILTSLAEINGMVQIVLGF